jgi:hypothetical protein
MSLTNDDQLVSDADATNRTLRATISECRNLLRQADERLGRTEGAAERSRPETNPART